MSTERGLARFRAVRQDIGKLERSLRGTSCRRSRRKMSKDSLGLRAHIKFFHGGLEPFATKGIRLGVGQFLAIAIGWGTARWWTQRSHETARRAHGWAATKIVDQFFLAESDTSKFHWFCVDRRRQASTAFLRRTSVEHRGMAAIT